MESLEKCVVTAMDGSDVELFPFLPYILQDQWEIGASPQVISRLLRKHAKDHSKMHILDLGCGKGAIMIKLAREFNCPCLGIDAIKEFINEANVKAKEFAVDHLCKFEVGDIRERIQTLPGFDIIILGAIGPVFGNYCSTLTTIGNCLNEDGMVVIDHGYIKNDSDFSHPLMQNQALVVAQIQDAGMQIIDEVIIEADEIKNADRQIFAGLKKRCLELIVIHPDKKKLFENYIKRQEVENHVLETKVVCSTMLIRKKHQAL